TEYHSSPDNFLGSKTQNDSWTGVVGMLKKREVETSCEGFLMTSERMDAVDFTVPCSDT
ncbi:hypothetical protein L9F63_024545, partial [Diploptera punctata]